MTVTREELIQASRLEQVELAKIVALENEFFFEVKEFLNKKYGEEWQRNDWLFTQEPRIVTQFKRDIFSKIENIVRTANHRLYNKICVEMNWCQNRKKPIFEYAEYIAAILDIFGASGVAALTILLIKRQFLDKLCNCGPVQ